MYIYIYILKLLKRRFGLKGCKHVNDMKTKARTILKMKINSNIMFSKSFSLLFLVKLGADMLLFEKRRTNSMGHFNDI